MRALIEWIDSRLNLLVSCALQGSGVACVCMGMDELEIVLALLESDLVSDDTTSFDETFDLDRDETREVTVVIDLEDQWTQPFMALRAPES